MPHPGLFFLPVYDLNSREKKTLSFNELSAPDNLHRLSALFRKLAIQQKD